MGTFNVNALKVSFFVRFDVPTAVRFRALHHHHHHHHPSDRLVIVAHSFGSGSDVAEYYH